MAKMFGDIIGCHNFRFHKPRQTPTKQWVKKLDFENVKRKLNCNLKKAITTTATIHTYLKDLKIERSIK